MTDTNKTTNQQWGGRFSEPVDAFVARFTASVEFDQRMAKQDIQGSIAHATMLAKVGVLTDEERDQIIFRRPYTDDDAGKTFFRLKDLELFLTKANFRSYRSHQIAQRLRGRYL